MSLRLRILDALYSALDNGCEEELVNSSPRYIAEDMQDHEIFEQDDFNDALEILEALRRNGEI